MRSGGKIGPRIAGIVGDEITRRKVAILPHAQRVAVGALNTFMDGIGAEARRTGGDLYDLLLAADGLPGWARRMFEFGRRGHGQWSALMSHSILNGGVAQSVFTVFNNELAPAVYSILRANPNGLIDIGTAAAAVARRIVSHDDGAKEAVYQGLDGRRFDQLVRMAQSTPSPADGLDMLRRGIVNTDTVSDIFRDAGLRDDWWSGTSSWRKWNSRRINWPHWSPSACSPRKRRHRWLPRVAWSTRTFTSWSWATGNLRA